MKIEKEIAVLLSKRYEMRARIGPGGHGRRALIKVMTYIEHGQKKSIIVDFARGDADKKRTFFKFETDRLSYKCSYFQKGDTLVFYYDGRGSHFLNEVYFRSHVDFESMTWEDLKKWKPLKEGEYEELRSIRKIHKKIWSWVIDKIESSSFVNRFLKNAE